MYIYDQYDHQILSQRVAQFRQQTERHLAGDLAEEAFLPLRLQNGLYVQRLAPMLRVNVPYGMISSKQIRSIARLSRDYDKGYVHITTRQNIQFNWPDLADVPEILAELAKVEMHATQSSGNCIRNTTTDQFAGVAPDELLDPRPYCEIIRQWSTLHPEFAFLPRKFKIAVNAAHEDRAASQVHDIGLELHQNDKGDIGFRVRVGGGLGRTPLIGSVVREFLPELELLSYLDAVLRVYNQNGRRDNKYKARIKILVKAMGVDAFAEQVEAEWLQIKDGYTKLTSDEVGRAKEFFTSPAYETNDIDALNSELDTLRRQNTAFDKWLTRNVTGHKVEGYTCVTLSLKPTGVAPGDVTERQLETIADLADEFSFGEARTTHEQNVVLSDVAKNQLFALWEKAKAAGFATPNIGTLTDIICCPGGDFCSLANAKSLPIADKIQRRFSDMDFVYDLGDIDLNISGCMNACAHHHVGNIGILGVDKKGEEFYQVQLGGNSGSDTSLGKVLGPSFNAEDIPSVIEKILDIFIEKRIEGESFLHTYRRVGMAPFKEQVYAKDH